MKEIKINSVKKGNFTVLVDDEDYDYVSSFTWWVALPNGKPYAFTTIFNHYTKKKFNVGMHRLLCNYPDLTVDHIDGNALNNQRANLRICTVSQNMMNKPILKINKTGFKGVFFQKELGKYRAQISIKNKAKHLGCFDDPIEAAKAYNEAAKKYYGEYANLNKIPCVGRSVA